MLNKVIYSVVLYVFCAAGGINVTYGAEKIQFFVSILPQQFFLERIGGEHVNVNVMVKPGQSPETFEPTPKLMNKLAHAQIFFTIGMPFEKAWMQRVSSINKQLIIADTQPEETYLLKSPHHTMHEFDPHTWLSPRLAVIQSEYIYENLIKLNRELRGYF